MIRLRNGQMRKQRRLGLNCRQKLVKRCVDLAVASSLLLCFAPVMGLCALAIKLEDGGDVIYKQQRVTYRGKIFYLYKFRSMKPNAEPTGKAILSPEHDPRVTHVGKVLRRFRLDELPQLVNVLRGEMSMVGPRPERPQLVREISKTLPEFTKRFCVQSGLTGLAQIRGAYDDPPEVKLRDDLEYIRNYSLLLDFQIMLQTPAVMLKPEKRRSKANVEIK